MLRDAGPRPAARLDVLLDALAAGRRRARAPPSRRPGERSASRSATSVNVVDVGEVVLGGTFGQLFDHVHDAVQERLDALGDLRAVGAADGLARPGPARYPAMTGARARGPAATRARRTPAPGSLSAGGRAVGSSPVSSLWIGTYPVAGAGTPVGLGEGIWRVDLASTAPCGTRGRSSRRRRRRSSRCTRAAGPVRRRTSRRTARSARSTSSATGSCSAATVPSGGADPCHLLLDVDGRALLVANYSSGTLGVAPARRGRAGSPATPAGARARRERARTRSGRRARTRTSSRTRRAAARARRRPGHGRDPPLPRARPDGLVDGRHRRRRSRPAPARATSTFCADGRFAYVVGELDVTRARAGLGRRAGTGTLVQTLPATTEPRASRPRSAAVARRCSTAPAPRRRPGRPT